MKLIFTLPKIPSMNAMYIKSRYGVCLSGQARSFKAEITKQYLEQIPEGDSPGEFSKDSVISLTVSFTLGSRFFIRDVDNMLKLTIDAVFKQLGVNDARILEMKVNKYFLKSDEETISFEIEESKLKYNL